MPSKRPSADRPKAEPSEGLDLSPSMQVATTTTAPRPSRPRRLSDAELDDALRRELGKAHDWVLEAPVPERLFEALRGKRAG